MFRLRILQRVIKDAVHHMWELKVVKMVGLSVWTVGVVPVVIASMKNLRQVIL